MKNFTLFIVFLAIFGGQATAQTCDSFSVTLEDSWIWGWEGGYLDIYINGTISISGLTIIQSVTPMTTHIPVDSGDVVSFDYTSGSSPGENKYTVYNQLGVVLSIQGAGLATPGDIGDYTIPTGLTACSGGGASCPRPTALAVSNISLTTVDLDWTENGSATTWDIEWGAVGFAQGSGTMILGTNTKPYNLTGLTALTTYDFYVRANCAGTVQSSWSDSMTFTTTTGNCAAPSALRNSNITLTSAYLNWTENGTATTWDIEWGLSGFAQGGGTMITNTSGKPYNLTALTALSTYDFYVRANCGVNGKSSWTGPTSFTVTISCPAVSALATSNLTTTSSYLNWTENGSATTWDIEWGTAGFAQGAGTMITNTSGKPYNLTGLAVATAYDFYVRANCGAGITSPWSGSLSFTTLAACPDASALVVSNTTATSADLGWTENGAATAWDIEWGAAGFAQGAGTMITATANKPYNLTSLTPSSGYDFYVRANCGSAVSDWSSSFTFITLASTAIDDELNKIKFDIYPNPNSGSFVFKMPALAMGEVKVEILAADGRVIFTKNDFKNTSEIQEEINLGNIASGIYYVSVSSDKGVAARKLLVQ